MYYKPAGFVTDQQIWMVGILCKYFLRSVMHFSHEDFLTAMKVDLGPILGETGLWALKAYEQRMADKGKDDKKKKARCAQDLISEFIENGFENLGKLSKYNIKNRYGPKKLPAQVVTRESIKHLYSWNHYAPLQWFTHTRKIEDMSSKVQKDGKQVEFNACSFCASPESENLKHKRCSACRSRLYCCTDCQKMDWKKGHNKECKLLAAKLPRA